MKKENLTDMPVIDKSNENENEMVWTLSEEGCLTVSGIGKMPDYSCGKNPAAPWMEKSERILEVRIGENITGIGVNAFKNCANLRRVFFPESLERIGAYAFQDCVSLEDVITGNRGFQYCYEPLAEFMEKHTRVTLSETAPVEDAVSYSLVPPVQFGLCAFFNTPWALRRWGGFYCADDVLYAVFTADRNLTVPETVRAIQKLAFAGTRAESILLPETLETIHDFAFYGCPVKQIEIPASVKSISPLAFLNSSLDDIEFPNGLGKIRFRKMVEETAGRHTEKRKNDSDGNAPDEECRMPGFYRVSRKSYRSSPVFERLLLFENAAQPEKIYVKKKAVSKKAEESWENAAPENAASENMALENAAPEKIALENAVPEKMALENAVPKNAAASPDDTAAPGNETEPQPPVIPCVLIPARIPFEKMLYTKIHEGEIYLCVEYDAKRVLCVKSFMLHGSGEDSGDGIKAYRMRPSRDIGLPVIWEDSYEYLDETAFLEAVKPCSFHSPENEPSAVRGIFHCSDGRTTTEWFRWALPRRVLLAGELELNLLDQWLKFHSRRHVLTAEENILEDEAMLQKEQDKNCFRN